MTDERKVEVTVEDTPEPSGPTVEVNVEEEKDDDEKEDEA